MKETELMGSCLRLAQKPRVNGCFQYSLLAFIGGTFPPLIVGIKANLEQPLGYGINYQVKLSSCISYYHFFLLLPLFVPYDI